MFPTGVGMNRVILPAAVNQDTAQSWGLSIQLKALKWAKKGKKMSKKSFRKYIQNILNREGLGMGDICLMSQAQFLKIKGLGRKSWEVLQAEIKSFSEYCEILEKEEL